MGVSAIHLAALQGNLNVCNYLIGDLKIDVNVKEISQGKTPLQCAILESQLSTAFYLLEKGANPDIADDSGQTSLHYAAGIGNKKLLHLLLSKGANVDALSTNGTALQKAALGGKQEVVKLLLNHRANPNLNYRHVCTPILASITTNSLRCMQLLLEAGADPKARGLGITPLELAATDGQADIVLTLLKSGANANQANKEGMRPIEVAALNGKNQVVEILLDKTKPISTYTEWSLGGIMRQIHSKTRGQSEVLNNVYGEEKLKGDKAFRDKDYSLAVSHYSKALLVDPSSHILLSNRSLCYLRLNNGKAALKDAMACVSLKPDWPKACYRAGSALSLLGDYENAAEALKEGLEMDPGNQEMKTAYEEAVRAKPKSVPFSF
ncbi:hypothetical protein ACHQM5_027318 [Ranunculus cassubicifolius]